jgi:hypothetical protein
MDSAQVERQIWSQAFELVKADIRKPVWQLLTQQVLLQIEGQVALKLSWRTMSPDFMLHALAQASEDYGG